MTRSWILLLLLLSSAVRRATGSMLKYKLKQRHGSSTCTLATWTRLQIVIVRDRWLLQTARLFVVLESSALYVDYEDTMNIALCGSLCWMRFFLQSMKETIHTIDTPLLLSNDNWQDSSGNKSCWPFASRNLKRHVLYYRSWRSGYSTGCWREPLEITSYLRRAWDSCYG